jgi:hypothetical protein
MSLPARLLFPSCFVHPGAFPWAALVHQGFTVQVVAVLDGDTTKSYTVNTLNSFASAGLTVQRRAKPMARTPSKPRQHSCTGKKSSFRLTASTSTGAPLPMCSCLMAPTSTTRWSKTAVAGGIGNMRQGYGAGRVGEGSTRGAERLVGRSAASAAVGVAETTQVVFLDNLSPVLDTSPRTA